MQRREFITLLGGAAAAWPFAAGAQQPKVSRIGALYIGTADAETFKQFILAFNYAFNPLTAWLCARSDRIPNSVSGCGECAADR